MLRKIFIYLGSFAYCTLAVATLCGATENADISTTNASNNIQLSETFGHLICRSIDNPLINFDLESIIKGMRDCASGTAAPMSEDQFEEVIATLQDESFQQMADSNLKQANAFLSNNRTNESVVELENGLLQYEVIQPGSNEAAVVTENTTPVVHYKGMCLDGTVFGDSAQVGGPITIPLNQTIPGFSKGIVGMKVGEKRKLFVHPEMAYGLGGDLPPNSLLVFEVELLDINTPSVIADEDLETLSTATATNAKG